MKLDILARYNQGLKTAQIASLMQLPITTVQSIKKNEKKIRECSQYVTENVGERIYRPRHATIHTTETLLNRWILDEKSKGMSLNSKQIQSKAQSLFEEVRATHSSDDHPLFIASKGWFDSFKKRFILKSSMLQDEVARFDDESDNDYTSIDRDTIYENDLYMQTNVDENCSKTSMIVPIHTTVNEKAYSSSDVANVDNEIVSKFLVNFRSMVAENEYSPKQIFHVCETGIFWKKIPSCTHITDKDANTFELKCQKDRLAFFLGGNASGVKLKPMLIYRSNNAKRLENINNNDLSVILKCNETAAITVLLLQEWLNDYFAPFVKKYNKKQRLRNKALLVMSHSLSHLQNIFDVHPHIQVVFLPSHRTSLQQVVRCVTSTFKAYCLRETIRKIVESMSTTLCDALTCWKNFKAQTFLDVVDLSWKSVDECTMHAIWKHIWPDFITVGQGNGNTIDVCKADTVKYFHEAGFSDINVDDIRKLLESHDSDIIGEDHTVYNDNQSEDFIEYVNNFNNSKIDRSERVEKLRKFLSLAEDLKIFASEVEEDKTRCDGFRSSINGIMSYYKQILLEDEIR